MELLFLIVSVTFAALGLTTANHQHPLGSRTDLMGIQPLGTNSLPSLLTGRSQRHFQNANRHNIASSRVKTSSLSEGIVGSSEASASSRRNWGIDTSVSDIARVGVARDAHAFGSRGINFNNVIGNTPSVSLTSFPQQTRQQGDTFSGRSDPSFRNRGVNVLSVSANSTARTVNTTSRIRQRRIMTNLEGGVDATNSAGGRPRGLGASMGSLTVPGQSVFTGGHDGMGGIREAAGSVDVWPEGINGIVSGRRGQPSSGTGVFDESFRPHGIDFSGRDGRLPGGSGAVFPELEFQGMAGSNSINGGGNSFRETNTNGIIDSRGSTGGRPVFSSGTDSMFVSSGPGSEVGRTDMNRFTDRVDSVSGESGIVSSGNMRLDTSASNGIIGKGVGMGVETGMPRRMVTVLERDSAGNTRSSRPLYVIDAHALDLLIQRSNTRPGAGGSTTTLQGEEAPELDHEEIIHPTTTNAIPRGEQRQRLRMGSGGSIQIDGRGTSIEFASGVAGGQHNAIGQNGSGWNEGGHQFRISNGGNGQGHESLVIEAGMLGSKGLMIGGPGSTLDIGGSSISVPGNATLIIGKSNG
ncbi:hypothetical protein ACJMK2_025551 [Sinanodonta woodiana]|uniref:Uncharacterized protein n=1 Tax=Sinanodonta woodiana TaxID=1069815 RepID=A0ABD3XJ94_SINWO